MAAISDRKCFIFDLHVTLMLSTKFLVSWPFGSREEAQNKFFKMVAIAAILDFLVFYIDIKGK